MVDSKLKSFAKEFGALITIVVGILGIIITFLAWTNPQKASDILLRNVDTPTPVVVERTVVATPTPGPTQTPVIESVEQEVNRVVEVTRVVEVEVTRVVIVTATPTPIASVNSAVASLEDDFESLDASVWEARSGNWVADLNQVHLTYDEDVTQVGLLLSGFDDWDDYAIETSVGGLMDYPTNRTVMYGCNFEQPGSLEGYSSDFMNGVPKATDDEGDPVEWDWCSPGLWNSRAAVLVGVDRTGSAAGLIVGENYMGWGTWGGNGWRTDPSRFVRSLGSSGADIRIEVRGIEYKVYINGQPVSDLDYIDLGRAGGRIGLWARTATAEYNNYFKSGDDWRLVPKFDYVRVMPLMDEGTIPSP